MKKAEASGRLKACIELLAEKHLGRRHFEKTLVESLRRILELKA